MLAPLISELTISDRKRLLDYVGTATLFAENFKHAPMLMQITLAPCVEITERTARRLGMNPLTESGRTCWNREVRVMINKQGLFRDKEGVVWSVTPKGLMRIADMTDSGADE